jgi:hypothetical protein
LKVLKLEKLATNFQIAKQSSLNILYQILKQGRNDKYLHVYTHMQQHINDYRKIMTQAKELFPLLLNNSILNHLVNACSMERKN